MTTPNPFVSKHPVVTYFTVAFAVSWGALLAVVGPGGFTDTTEPTSAQLHSSSWRCSPGPLWPESVRGTGEDVPDHARRRPDWGDASRGSETGTGEVQSHEPTAAATPAGRASRWNSLSAKGLRVEDSVNS